MQKISTVDILQRVFLAGTAAGFTDEFVSGLGIIKTA